jgi:hypothetical protein
MIGFFGHRKRLPRMSGLTTGGTRALLPQAFRGGLLKPIGGRRFAAVMAVLGQLIGEFFDPPFQHSHASIQLQQHTDHRLFPGTINGQGFFPSKRMGHFASLFWVRFVRRRVSRWRVSIVHSTISPFLKSMARAIAAGKFTYHCSVFFRSIN